MRILILSRNSALYSTQSLLRACYRRGHFARVIDHQMCDLVIDTNRLAIYYQGEELSGFDAIIPRIGSSVTNSGTNLIRQFEFQGIFTTTRADAILRARNKWRCFQILAAEGIPVPKSIIPNYLQIEESFIRDQFDTPLVIKLLESTHGLGVILSENYQNAVTTIEAFHRLKEMAMMQEFIKESSGSDIRVIVVDGEVIASMVRQAREGEFRSNLHRGASARVVRLTEEEKRISRKVCKILGLDVAGVDLLRSAKGPLLLEVNSSPGLEGIESVTGIDIAGAVIKYIERRIRKHRKYQMRKAK